MEMNAPWNLGTGAGVIDIDKYLTGSGTYTVKYKTGNSPANCVADIWNTYSGGFTSLGWAMVRVEG
jgi:hypothetical protein